MRREKLLNFKSLSLKNIYASLVVILIILASITGATYAWFVAQVAVPETNFIAGTVRLSPPEIEVKNLIKPGRLVNHGFVPNSWDASVSKVNLVDFKEVARYYTAPRDGVVDVRSWRTNRIAMDADGNAWALNTGTDAFRYDPAAGLQGQVVRIQGDTEGLATTHAYPDPVLEFGTDEAVQVFDVGGLDDMPRAIAVDANGYIWVGFYGSGELHQYAYDEINEELNLVGGPFTPVTGTIHYYEMKFAPSGDLFISSRSSTPSVSGNFGIWRFDDVSFHSEQSFASPYALLVAPDGTVYSTSYNKILRVRDTDGTWSQVTIGDAQNLRGMQLDGLGNLWIASTTGPGGGNRVIWYELDTGLSGFVTLQDGNTPVGVGRDAAGLMWAICRTDNQDDGFIEAIDPVAKEVKGSIKVGPRPYAYGDFSLVDDRCKTVKWKFENIGTKKVYVRVKPTASLSGNTVEITLCEQETKWMLGSDGWYYYGNASGPTIVPIPDTSNPFSNVVNVCFNYCFAAETGNDLIVKLEAEAIQWSNDAIDHKWVGNPWFNVNR